MTILQKRKELEDYMAKTADKDFIAKVHAYMKQRALMQEPMTEEEFLARYRKSRKDAKAGRLHTISEVRERVLGKR